MIFLHTFMAGLMLGLALWAASETKGGAAVFFTVMFLGNAAFAISIGVSQ